MSLFPITVDLFFIIFFSRYDRAAAIIVSSFYPLTINEKKTGHSDNGGEQNRVTHLHPFASLLCSLLIQYDKLEQIIVFLFLAVNRKR